jgi:hypothetical protein
VGNEDIRLVSENVDNWILIKLNLEKVLSNFLEEGF